MISYIIMLIIGSCYGYTLSKLFNLLLSCIHNIIISWSKLSYLPCCTLSHGLCLCCHVFPLYPILGTLPPLSCLPCCTLSHGLCLHCCTFLVVPYPRDSASVVMSSPLYPIQRTAFVSCLPHSTLSHGLCLCCNVSPLYPIPGTLPLLSYLSHCTLSYGLCLCCHVFPIVPYPRHSASIVVSSQLYPIPGTPPL